MHVALYRFLEAVAPTPAPDTTAPAAGGHSVPSDIVNIAPTAPPGSGGFTWGVAIILWLAFLVCLAGIAKAGGHLAWAGIKPNQGGSNGAAELMFSGVGLIITASAGAIMTAIAALT